VEADIAAARAGRPFKSSNGCAPDKISTKSARDGCEAFHKLEGELEAGRAAARLEQTAAAIRTRLATGTAVQTVDPGATAVSLIVGTSPDNIAAWSALLGYLALELAGMIAMMRAEIRSADMRFNSARSSLLASAILARSAAILSPLPVMPPMLP
jgi:hypothetical protein